ncbi:hypothetical protein [Yoonia sp. MH D7]
MTPEATILLVNAIFLAFAYLWVYPNLTPITIARAMRYDLIISAACLTVAGLLFWGTGTPFRMVFFNSNWAVFSIVTLLIMETPLFFWFAKKHDLTL